MKILIIGGTGFVGRHLQTELSNEHELIIFHRGEKVTDVRHQSILGDRKELAVHRDHFARIQPDVVIDF